MGSKIIWILASIGYGVVTAALYVWICYRRGCSRLSLRFFATAVCATLLGLMICAVLWLLVPTY